jgi:hypothetical protein
LEENLPLIQNYLLPKLEGTVREIAEDDQQLSFVLRTIYNLMPFAFRMTVPEKDFITFCIQNKSRLLNRNQNS